MLGFRDEGLGVQALGPEERLRVCRGLGFGGLEGLVG